MPASWDADEIRDYMADMSHDRLTTTHSGIEDVMNDGLYLVFHRDHGGETKWGNSSWNLYDPPTEHSRLVMVMMSGKQESRDLQMI
ncbi:MAG: hypothetical protein GF388_05120 [Candidatus Aegiribacteria sp.]|nr:hypothetical protein [Candidatus Aegiribacteria sp.]MBD3294597.1 hypothetical protein [Candidatus Fermentibacteria bacterium]